MPGFHWSRSFAFGAGLALGERPDHAEHVVDVVGLRVAELAHRLVQRARTAAGAAAGRGGPRACRCPSGGVRRRSAAR